MGLPFLNAGKLPSDTIPALIIGAGLGGIAMAIALQKAGIHDFRMVEKSPKPGGVWWDNSYPGAEVDSPIHSYSFSFHRFPWSRNYAGRDELLRYIDDIMERFSLWDRSDFGVTVQAVTWEDELQGYRVETDQSVLKARVVISAVGTLNIPQYPDWPGLESFEGPRFHTSRWEHQHDLCGKTVAVVGTGATAVQVVANIAPDVGKLYVFQREPGWFVPKDVRAYSDAERQRLTRPWRYRVARLLAHARTEGLRIGGKLFIPDTKANLRAREIAINHIKRSLADRPDLMEAVTPKYAYLGKRVVRDGRFYQTLLRNNVVLVPRPVASVESDALVDSEGNRYPTDILVMSTGFKASAYLSQFEIKGRSGRTIQEVWNGSPRAMLGVAVPDFPNFFIMYGPNTNIVPLLLVFEAQSKVIAQAVKHLLRSGAGAVEAADAHFERFNAWIERRLDKTAWKTSNNYFKSVTGRIVTQWPDGAILYIVMLRVFGWKSLKFLGKAPTRGSRGLPRAIQF